MAELLAGVAAPDEADGGVAVDLFESPNLDRFLRRAEQFLGEEKFPEAIEVLQSVVEGRTLIASAVGEEAEAEAPEEARLADPATTVYSQDGRIYRPARRLCHEMLAGMPTVGLGIYRSLYEAQARELLQRSLNDGDLQGLQRVYTRYFVTLAAGEAMVALANRSMHEGQYRNAAQIYRDLISVYPDENLRRLNLNPLWCRFRIALCLRMSGEPAAARDVLAQMAADAPRESLRIMGELQPVASLAASPMFDLAADVAVGTAPQVSRPDWFAQGDVELVPLWQYRFRGNDPYAAIKEAEQDNSFVFFSDGIVVNAAPHATKYGTGTRIAFRGEDGPLLRAVFLENFKVREAKAFSGILNQEADGLDLPPRPRESYSRARVPVYDFTLQRTVEDEDRIYAVLGNNKPSQGVESLRVNEIVAYDKADMRRLWSTTDFEEGVDSYFDVTFLAPPTVFRERLFVPVLKEGVYSLQCAERKTGQPIWRTRLHGGGTDLFKAPGCQVVMFGSSAVALTNAGVIASVDAYSGAIEWMRRYERSDPLRPAPVERVLRRSQSGFMQGGSQFQERNMQQFLPSDLISSRGLVVFAACDSQLIIALDSASGQPLWMVDGAMWYGRFGELNHLLGANDDDLFAVSESHLVCIGLRSGLVKWSKPLPQTGERATRWRGRGCILPGAVAIPGDREITIASADGQGDWVRLPLPSFREGEEQLHGAANLVTHGPWLGVCYSTGIEVYSSRSALLALAASADDATHRVSYLVQAGGRENTQQALEGLRAHLAAGNLQGTDREAVEERLVGLARELEAQHGAEDALATISEDITTRDARLRWYLARLEAFKMRKDVVSYSAEQQRLYRYMEGRD